MKNNVLLLRVESKEDKNKFFPPFGLLYISSALNNINIKTKILHDYESKELFERVLEYIKENSPIWVGFSVITNKGLMSSLNLTRLIKSKFPNIPIIWGGIHPTMCPEQTLREKSIDYIAIKEGEIVAQKLTKCLLKTNNNKNLKRIKGLGYKIGNKIVINQPSSFIKNLDQFKINFKEIPIEKYISEDIRWKGKIFPLITSRGCPFPCRFCYNQAVNNRKWRGHSAEYVKKQIKYLHDKFKIKNFLFYDDNFFVDKKRAFEITKNLPGQWMGELRANYFDEDFVKRIKKTGCNLAFIGAESGSERVLKEVINKCATKEEINQAIKLSKEHNLNIGISFIIGFPGERREEMFETLDYIYETAKFYPSANIDIHIFKPYPGTPLYYESVKRGFNVPKNLEDWGHEKYYQERANNPWVKDQKELEGIRDTFSFFILLYKKRKGVFNLLRLFSIFEVLRIKFGLYNNNFELRLFKRLRRLFEK